jgi:hypothetical protein
MEEAMALADICLPSLDDMTSLSGLAEPDAIVDHCLRLGARTVALKRGSDGALVADASRRAHRADPDGGAGAGRDRATARGSRIQSRTGPRRPLIKQGRTMRVASRIGALALAAVLLALSGCAVNRATATVDPAANLAALKTLNVVQQKEDNQVYRLITDRLTQLGFVATSGPEKRKDVDANVTYVDKWFWDITMYLLELTIVVRDPATDFPLASGNSMHTSLTRLGPKEMVEEVTGNIFKGVKK